MVKVRSGAKLTSNALRVLEKRYLRRDESGEIIETPDEMFRRVANAVAAIEASYDKAAAIGQISDDFYQAMANLEFLPNSLTLLNAGEPNGQLASCFVLPTEDSLEATFETVKYTALIHKAGGGTGFNFSKVRPKNDRVGGRLGVSAGPVGLIDVIATAADYIRQGGVRRGCNSVVLNVDHPDILEFIKAKNDPNALTNFYISVAVSDDFMARVKAGADYSLINPRNGQAVGTLNAKKVFERIVDQAWHTGDPGFIFLDRINRDNPTPQLGTIDMITGCGEQALLPYESCPLGSINLSRMLKNERGTLSIDYDKIQRMVELGVRFLDNVIDASSYPDPIIEKATKRTRRIGLGVMGFADLLFQLGNPYNSESAETIATDIMGFIQKQAHEASHRLAQKRGSFPGFTGSVFDFPGAPPRRNAACTTVAPTGTLSIIAGCSCGIEPLFSVAFVRHMLDGERLLEVNPYFEKAVRESDAWTADLLERLVRCNHLHEQADVPESIRNIFVTAHQVSPEWHVRIQSAFQKNIDAAVSKTVNFPNSATRDEIARVFFLAHESGLKGITIYRDGSRELQPQCTGEFGLCLVGQYCEINP
ncbi:adenosylcobalamin-dependent ribonucleoside-diphosphate reductase [Dehalogenimonas formicexedens]|uniref:adenosylcobalamin-dependent ribonucleoside-diphosphate reductase n=1 Tax=Dehalogenimonas formicexedens TaxID=1839801 RepID=UPI001CEFA51B|nr:adenosylcobalamin-dependent ribonucleoside-diphosphate reductase [Dehalogenimonas formicexedens]